MPNVARSNATADAVEGGEVSGGLAIGVANRGEDPWWELIAVIVGVLTVSAAATWCTGIWVGAKMRPPARADVA